MPNHTPLEAAEFIVAVADAAGWLIANSDPQPRLDMTVWPSIRSAITSWSLAGRQPSNCPR
jgi:hypothetical protein